VLFGPTATSTSQDFIEKIDVHHVQQHNWFLPTQSSKRYTKAQCIFIANAIKACVNPDPNRRPSAAQLAKIFEQFSNGETNFNNAYASAKRTTETPVVDLFNVGNKSSGPRVTRPVAQVVKQEHQQVQKKVPGKNPPKLPPMRRIGG
jgi:hypothetical protein